MESQTGQISLKNIDKVEDLLPGRRLLHPHDGAVLDVLAPDLGRVVSDHKEVLGVEGVPLHLRDPGSLGEGEGRYCSLIGQYYILLFSHWSI